jgi:hypothetical protein
MRRQGAARTEAERHPDSIKDVHSGVSREKPSKRTKEAGAEPLAEAGVEEPAAEAGAELTPEARHESAVEAGAEPAAEPRGEPPVEAGAEPAAEPRCESGHEPRHEPAVEARGEPAVEAPSEALGVELAGATQHDQERRGPNTKD